MMLDFMDCGIFANGLKLQDLNAAFMGDHVSLVHHLVDRGAWCVWFPLKISSISLEIRDFCHYRFHSDLKYKWAKEGYDGSPNLVIYSDIYSSNPDWDYVLTGGCASGNQAILQWAVWNKAQICHHCGKGVMFHSGGLQMKTDYTITVFLWCFIIAIIFFIVCIAVAVMIRS